MLYLLNDVVLEDTWKTGTQMDLSRAGDIRTRLAPDGRSRFGVATPIGEAVVEATASTGGTRALLTISLNSRPVLSSIVLRDSDEAASELMTEFLASLRRTTLVTQHAPEPSRAFSRIESARERPLVGSVHWPAIAKEQFAALAALDTDCAAALLWRDAP